MLHDRNTIHFEQNCKVERERERERVHYDAHSRASQEKECKRAQNWGMDEFSRQELRESQFTVTEPTPQIQELQDKENSMNDSREFQDVESVCSSRLSHVPTHPVIVSSPCGFSLPRSMPATLFTKLTR